MSKKLIAAFPQLKEEHRARLREAAEKYGYVCECYADDRDAIASAADAEILLVTSSMLCRHAPQLKWVCTTTAGVNHFAGEDVFAAKDAILTNSSGAYGVTISEHILMSTLEVLRCAPAYAENAAAHAWDREKHIRSIYDARITILGTGDIATESAKRFRAFCPKSIAGVNRTGRPNAAFDLVTTDVDALLPQTDVLVIALPGTKATRHLLSRERLRMLPDDAVIVNVGRGSIIDQNALADELRAKRLWAALDVFEKEPIPADDPLWDCPNLIITPHISGLLSIPQTTNKLVSMFLENFERYVKNEPMQRVIDLEKGY